MKKPENSLISTFLYPDSARSPHPVHLSWAKLVCKNIIKTPFKSGITHFLTTLSYNIKEIPYSDFLLIESLYCLPFAKKYKESVNPDCKIISIIADTSFWKQKISIFRKIFYKFYLNSVDGFITVSERIKKDILSYIKKPVEIVRPFFTVKYRKKNKSFNNKLLFIGNESKEKGILKLISAMKLLPDFELFLVGNCYKIVKLSFKNVHIEGWVSNLEKYFENCSYYIHPADFDPCPVVVFEAMYSGLIPIISNNVGQSELFTDDLKFLILNNNYPETISFKIKKINNLSDLEKAEIINKCKILSEKYDRDKSLNEFHKKYFKLIDLI